MTPNEKVYATKTILLWFARNALGKYFNLIIRQRTKTVLYLIKSLSNKLEFGVAFYFLSLCMYASRNAILHSIFCACVCVCVYARVWGSLNVAFWFFFDCTSIHKISKFSTARTQQFMAFNVLMTLTTFKLWICCIHYAKWDRKSQHNALTLNCPSL